MKEDNVQEIIWQGLGKQRPPQILFPLYLISIYTFQMRLYISTQELLQIFSYPFTNKFLYQIKVIGLMTIKIMASLSRKQPTVYTEHIYITDSILTQTPFSYWVFCYQVSHRYTYPLPGALRDFHDNQMKHPEKQASNRYFFQLPYLPFSTYYVGNA